MELKNDLASPIPFSKEDSVIAMEKSERLLLLVGLDEVARDTLSGQLAGEGYTLLAVPSATRALEVVAVQPISVLIANQELQDMPVIDLLNRLRQSHPHVVRILFTEHLDRDVVTRAVNQSEVYRYLIKPWDADELRHHLREAFHYHDLLEEKARLDEEIRRTNQELRQINEALQQRLSHQSKRLVMISQYDGVTELPNRLLFTDRLKQSLVRVRNDNGLLAVFVIGLDHFMLINETMGQSGGDQLLHAVARRLQSCIGPGDSVARFGGDEFILLLSEVKSVEEVNAVLDRIRNRMAEPFVVGGRELFVSSCMGISLYPYDGNNDEELIKHANTAMHHAKQEGAGRYKFYTEEMNVAASEWLELEYDLRQALKHGEFQLYYQPQYRLEGMQLVGVEALLRWQHPEKGIISPQKFLPILEKTGMIVPVGEWTFREACRQYLEWQRQDIPLQAMSINLSVRQFGSDYLIDMMENVIRELDLDLSHHQVRLEVTEHLVIEDLETTSRVLTELKNMGFHIAVDDFGTGYASLHYLTRFPVGSLKIDRIFINRLDSEVNDANLAKAIIAMAHSLGLQVTAEGVETEQQLEFLRRHHCDEVQGYLLGQPMPAAEMAAFMQRPFHDRAVAQPGIQSGI